MWAAGVNPKKYSKNTGMSYNDRQNPGVRQVDPNHDGKLQIKEINQAASNAQTAVYGQLANVRNVMAAQGSTADPSGGLDPVQQMFDLNRNGALDPEEEAQYRVYLANRAQIDAANAQYQASLRRGGAGAPSVQGALALMNSGYAYPQVSLQANAQQTGGNAQAELANQSRQVTTPVAGSAPAANAAAMPTAAYWSSNAPRTSGNGAAAVSRDAGTVSSATAQLEGLVDASSGGRFGTATPTPTPAPSPSPFGARAATSPTPLAVTLPNGMRVEGMAPAASATPAAASGTTVVTLDNGTQLGVGPGASVSPSPSSLDLPP